MLMSGFGSGVSGRCRKILGNPTSTYPTESVGSAEFVGNVGFWGGEAGPAKDSVE